MSGQSHQDVTALLMAWGNGDEDALSRLTPFVYDELHRLAEGYMRREHAGHTLQTTALVNEADIKLVDYNFAKYGSSVERKRLLEKWDKEVGGASK